MNCFSLLQRKSRYNILRIKELLSKLGPYEIEGVDISNHCVYELKNGSLYKGGWLEDKKSGKGYISVVKYTRH